MSEGKKNGKEIETHADGEDGSDFVHGVAVRVLRDVDQRRAGRQLVADLVHDVVRELFHALRRSSKTNKLSSRCRLEINSRHSLRLGERILRIATSPFWPFDLIHETTSRSNLFFCASTPIFTSWIPMDPRDMVLMCSLLPSWTRNRDGKSTTPRISCASPVLGQVRHHLISESTWLDFVIVFFPALFLWLTQQTIISKNVSICGQPCVGQQYFDEPFTPKFMSAKNSSEKKKFFFVVVRNREKKEWRARSINKRSVSWPVWPANDRANEADENGR